MDHHARSLFFWNSPCERKYVKEPAEEVSVTLGCAERDRTGCGGSVSAEVSAASLLGEALAEGWTVDRRTR